MEWWQWIVLGAGILAAETLIDSEFYLIFVGISAIAVGLNHFAPYTLPVWGQWLLLAALAVVSVVAFRNKLYLLLRGNPPEIEDGVRGEVAIAVEAIGAGGHGVVELRGSTWAAHNTADEPIFARGRARVERTEGLTLLVRPEP